MKSFPIRAPQMRVPLYASVRRMILQCLEKGEWHAGEKLPAEPELAHRFGVAVPTLRVAVGDLVAMGVLDRYQGKGTFVTQHNSPRHELRYSNIFTSRGKKSIDTVRKDIFMKKVKPDSKTADQLALGINPDYIWRIRAALEANTKVVALLELSLPFSLFSRLTKAHIEQNERNLYSIYQTVCGVTVLRMEERVFARSANRTVAMALGVKVGHPTLVVDRRAFTVDDRPIEVRQRTFEGLSHEYRFAHAAERGDSYSQDTGNRRHVNE